MAEKQSKERYRAIVENRTEMICCFLQDGTLTFVNESYCRYFNKNREELIGHKFLPLIPDDDREKVFKNISTLNPKNPIVTHEHRVLSPSGEVFWQKWTNRAIFDDQNNLLEYQAVGWDITKRKQTEEALRESQYRYSLIFNGSRDAVFIAGSDAKFIDVNDAASVLTGYSKAELKRMSIPDLHEKVDLHAYETYFESIMAGEPVLSEAKILRKDGMKVDTEFSNTRIEIRGIPFMHSVARDITDRKQAEKALTESEERYRALAENSQVGFWHITVEGHTIYLNPSMCSMLEIESSEDLSEQTYHPFFSTESLEIMEHERATRQKGKGSSYEVEIIGKNGGRSVVMISGAPILSTEGTLQSYIGTFTDITFRKKVEKALRESEERFRTLVETMNDGLGIQDKNGLITYVNNKFCLMLGYKPDDFIGRPVSDFLDENNKRKLKDQMSDRIKKKAKPYELVWDRKDGSKLPTLMSPQAIFDEKKQFKGSFAVITDISDLKRIEKALQKAHDELEQRVEERTKELDVKTKSLEELNTALKVLLEKRAKDRRLLEDNVLINVKELTEPLFDKMRKTELDDHQKMILSIIESNLNEITSPLTRKLSLKYLKLTPTEIKIANLIRHGTTTKKIAKLMNSSPRTIDTHRKNIRRKMGLEKKRANLRSYLLSID